MNVAIVGCGLVGRAWAIAFARAGNAVRLWDPDPDAPARAIAVIGELLPDLAHHDLLRGSTPAEVTTRLQPVATLAQALGGAGWMQESAPEDRDVKRALWAEIDPLAPADCILSSSTSAIRPSLFTDHLAGRHRCVVAHPLNPPYLIPATELVPAPWTSAETMARAETILRGIGQAPIVMRKEVDGFVMNRLQGALLEEAFRLVDDGVCGPEDVDIGLREGLALRWSFMGPFETIDLNAPGGVRDYILRYEKIYVNLFQQMQHRSNWAGPVADTIETARRARVPAERLGERSRWRDRRLMALAAHKRKAAQEIGD